MLDGESGTGLVEKQRRDRTERLHDVTIGVRILVMVLALHATLFSEHSLVFCCQNELADLGEKRLR